MLFKNLDSDTNKSEQYPAVHLATIYKGVWTKIKRTKPTF